ncbi:hypothetical protein EVAR_18709_1, partial [Eumeta japonica]
MISNTMRPLKPPSIPQRRMPTPAAQFAAVRASVSNKSVTDMHPVRHVLGRSVGRRAKQVRAAERRGAQHLLWQRYAKKGGDYKYLWKDARSIPPSIGRQFRKTSPNSFLSPTK